MTTLKEQIDALPEWPVEIDVGYPPPDDAEWNDYLHEKLGAALARLALARQWIATSNHDDTCDLFEDYSRDASELTCTCGKDALLQALEVQHD